MDNITGSRRAKRRFTSSNVQWNAVLEGTIHWDHCASVGLSVTVREKVNPSVVMDWEAMIAQESRGTISSLVPVHTIELK